MGKTGFAGSSRTDQGNVGPGCLCTPGLAALPGVAVRVQCPGLSVVPWRFFLPSPSHRHCVLRAPVILSVVPMTGPHIPGGALLAYVVQGRGTADHHPHCTEVTLA